MRTGRYSSQVRRLLPPFPPYTDVTTLGIITSSSAYLSPSDPARESAEVTLGVSTTTGLASLLSTLSPESLVHEHAWLSLSEPQAHLPQVVTALADRVGHLSKVSVLGLSEKDASTLALLEPLVARTSIVSWSDSRPDCTVTRQDWVSSQYSQRVPPENRADVVVCRHLLEHAYDLKAFLDGLFHLLAPGGQILIEVPNCERSMQTGDYTILWEEHVHYFTPDSLRSTLEALGWTVDLLLANTADGEDVLWCFSRPTVQTLPPSPLIQSTRGLQITQKFCGQYSLVRQAISERLRDSRRDRVVFFGANHVTSTVLDLLMPGDQPVVVLDDSQHKQGRQVSRRRVTVVSLEEARIGPSDLLLIAINRARAQKVVHRLTSTREPSLDVQFLSDWLEMITP